MFFHGLHRRIETIAVFTFEASQCAWLIVDTQALALFHKEVDASAWTQHATVRRPSDNNEDIVLFRALSTPVTAKP
jgi:hypothetical protein